MLEAGAPLPAVAAPDEAGNLVELKKQAGPLVIWFYPKADTPG